MTIHGLQKMTLLDYPGRVACTVFLGGCDLRCPFCHNFDLATGAAPAVMEDAEFFAFLEKRRGLLDGVAVTGGEPCLRPDLPDFLRRIRSLGFLVKLDTNGTHPALLREILRDSLCDYVAMDVKNSPAKYARTCGLPSFDLSPVLESIGLLKREAPAYEFRTTVVRELHEASDFHEIGRMIAGARRCFLQAFTDRESVPFAGFTAPSREEMEGFAAILARYAGETGIRGMD